MQLPNFDEAFTYENNFYLSCDVSRLTKLLSQYELYKRTRDLPGALVECGVFKGVSLARFAMMREIFGGTCGEKIIGFDVFGDFPDMVRRDDVSFRARFIEQTGTPTSISVEQLMTVLKHKNVHENVELVAGDITETIPAYVKEHPELKISLLNMDTGTYDSSLTILEHLFPKVVSGGVVLLDNYGAVAGETQAVDEYFAGRRASIKKHPFALSPCFLIKE